MGTKSLIVLRHMLSGHKVGLRSAEEVCFEDGVLTCWSEKGRVGLSMTMTQFVGECEELSNDKVAELVHTQALSDLKRESERKWKLVKRELGDWNEDLGGIKLSVDC